LPLDMHSNTRSLSSCRPWLSEQYPSNGTTWQWFSLDSSSIYASSHTWEIREELQWMAYARLLLQFGVCSVAYLWQELEVFVCTS
jgi:hypothetical protein